MVLPSIPYDKANEEYAYILGIKKITNKSRTQTSPAQTRATYEFCLEKKICLYKQITKQYPSPV